MVARALPLLLGFLWKEMHTDKPGSHLWRVEVDRSMTINLQILEKLLKGIGILLVLKFRSLLSGLCLSTQSLDFRTILWSQPMETGMKRFSLTSFLDEDSTQAEHLEGNSLSDCSLSDLEMLKFLMGLDDSYTQIRSSILSREVLHDVRSAYATISSEESHEVASGSIVGSSQRNQPSIFVSNVPNVGHPDGIKAFISKIGNLKLPNGLVQFDVMDLNLKKVMGIGNQCGGLYHFNDKDDYIRVVWVYLVKSKDEVAFDISIFYNLIENQFKRKIKVRSDNGIEIVNQTVNKFCNDKGIVHQTFCTYTPQQNGIAERKHRHLLNVVRSLLFHERIPLKMWTECILTATYLINRLPYSVLIRKSPYDIIYKKPPTLSHLRVFGCLCFATVVNNHAKFGNSASKEKELDTSNVFQDLNHINFFNNEYPEMPYDDERVDPNLNSDQRSQSDSSHSSVPGRDMNTVDFSDDTFGNDAQNTNDIFAAQDEQSGNGIFLALLVYVDDIIITGNNVYEIEKFKVYLKSKFMIKGLGKLKYFLSIEVIDTEKGICLNQRKYVLDLLSEYDMLACKPTKTPLMSKLSISNKATDNDPILDNITDYQKLMGKLIYLTNTRLDIFYVVHYLEYRALASVTSEVIWILKTLKDLKIDDRLPVFLYCDINSAIKIAANLVFMKEQKT
ncbi:ribonuclease H-like domain-containing protein [Tanacetum coccineum]|uniref:Ribonuclease H-like domain-containing protein n=1 Tax=Tanacetum coccineum TaxID=301880 RepID=A0ABQ4X7D9_9ASTR